MSTTFLQQQEQLHSDACIALFSLSRKVPSMRPSQVLSPPNLPVPLLSPAPTSPHLDRSLCVPSLLLNQPNKIETSDSYTNSYDSDPDHDQRRNSRSCSFVAAKTLESLFFSNFSEPKFQAQQQQPLLPRIEADSKLPYLNSASQLSALSQRVADYPTQNFSRNNIYGYQPQYPSHSAAPYTEPILNEIIEQEKEQVTPVKEAPQPTPMETAIIHTAEPLSKPLLKAKLRKQSTKLTPKSSTKSATKSATKSISKVSKPKAAPKSKSKARSKTPSSPSPIPTISEPLSPSLSPSSSSTTTIDSMATDCADCGKPFASTSELRRHQKLAHQRQTFKCRTCGLLFSSIADRQTHKNNKHFGTIRIHLKNMNFGTDFSKGSEVESTRNENGQFGCPAEYCSFVTRIPGYWYDHVNSVEHTGVDPQKRKKRKIN